MFKHTILSSRHFWYLSSHKIFENISVTIILFFTITEKYPREKL